MGFKAIPPKAAQKTPQNIKAAHWVAVDATDGEHSVDSIRAKHEANLAAQNESARNTWTPSPSLTDKQRKVVDSNPAGHFKTAATKPTNPAGFKSAESTLESSVGASGSPDQPSQGPQPLMKIKK